VKLLFLTGRELTYTRNDVLLRAFHRLGEVDVLGVSRRPGSLLANSLRVSLQAVPRLRRGEYDLVFVGFYGHLLMLAVGPLTRPPVLFDAFVSTYDTLIEDRQVSGQSSLLAWGAKALDRAACRLANLVLLDTPMHIDYFVEQYHLPLHKFASCPVGCNEDIFYPRPQSPQGGRSQVLYYTSYLPLHGVETVIQAAELLRSQPFDFKLIGSGQTYSRVRALVNDLKLRNINFAPPVPLERLPVEISSADICLGGHFGASPKAGRVVPGKIYQLLAMGSPIIATNTLANLALLRHLESAYLVPPNDPQALAQALMQLSQEPALRRQIADSGRHLYLEKCSELAITEMLKKIVKQIIGR
jgi:glycosyltransferase involved in cell wall biosynthesis